MTCFLKIKIFAWLVVPAIALWLLAGCVTGTDVTRAKHTPVVQEVLAIKGASVVRLADGRKGFVITEAGSISDALRKDFTSAVAMLNGQDYVNAIDLLQKIIEQSPGVTAPYINIAIAYQHTGKAEQAEGYLKTALSLVPGHPVACNQYGLLYRKSGRFEEAREIYEKALKSFPEYYPAHRNLGILCDLYLNDLACALKHYEIYSLSMPEDSHVKMWIADLRARLGTN
ncbi:MAG: tetratricopeptide repeat protein [Deltaproteobacteria bacterium]|nr:tetratricopeptide repeat protein [Deltaproteobacteria bacterium]